MVYELPKLSYAYNALEPVIDAHTMEIHHTKHHQAYVTNLNTVLAKYPLIADTPLEELLGTFEALEMDEKDKTMFKNNAGGHLNHSLFWEIMGNEKEEDEKLTEEIKATYGTVEEFRELFGQTALKHFGSGWAWLVRDETHKLSVYSLPNQDSPYLKGHTPLIGLDVWEHAYYLHYQNRRAEYIENWWKILKSF